MKQLTGTISIDSILATAAIDHPDKVAFHCSSTGRRATFRELDERTNRLANALERRGVRKGDVVAFLISNRLEIVEVYFALARTGAVGLPLNYRLAPVELVELTRAMPAGIVIFEQRFSAAVDRIRETAPSLKQAIIIDAAGSEAASGYEESLAASEPTRLQADVADADPFYFGLTSGTTGLPKGYILTHANNTAMAALFQCFDMSGDDVAMTVFPMFGRVGFGWAVCSIVHAIPNVLANFEPEQALRLIGEHKVSIVNIVPTMAAMMLGAKASRPDPTTSLRAIVFAGASLPASIREETARALCPTIYEYYGMNEMGALFLSRPEDRAPRPGSVGRRLPFVEAKIVDQNGNIVGPGVIGEVLGRSPMSAANYHDSPEKSAETFRDGWVHTGDLGYLDEDDYLYLRGRRKDMIVTGGQNVYAAEVEAIILRHPGIADCTVIGLPDDFWGEQVTGVVIPHPGAAPTEAELDAFCRDYLASFKVPKRFILDIETLPRNSTGKVQKFILVEQLTPTGATGTPC